METSIAWEGNLDYVGKTDMEKNAYTKVMRNRICTKKNDGNECKQEWNGKLNTLGIYEKEYAVIRMAQRRICTRRVC